MSYENHLSQADKAFLAEIKQGDRENGIVDKVQLFCTQWTLPTNGSAISAREITNLLYDIAQLPDEKQAVCKKALVDAGVFKSKSKLEKRLKAIPSLTKKDETTPSSKPVLSAKFEGLVDLVEDQNRVRFLIKERNGTLIVVDSHNLRGTTLTPPSKDQLPYRLPRWDKVKIAYESDEPGKLFTDLLQYHERISKLPSENHLLLFAAWDFSTYRQELLSYSGYLTFFNVAGRGKTRTGLGLINVAFRGIHTITLRESSLFRFSNDLQASLFLDVMDLSKKLEKCDSEDILLQRFQKGARIARVLNPEGGPFKDTVYYDVFGPTVIATNAALDKILDTRCFPISMPHSSKHYPDPDPHEGQLLRERLVAWRARRLQEPLKDPGRILSGRLGDISMPLRSIINEVKPTVLSAFDDLIEQMQEYNRGEKSDSIEGRIIQAIRSLLPLAYGDKLSLPTIGTKLNDGIREETKDYINPYKLGRHLNSLGFKKDRTSTERFIWIDREQLESMCKEYGIQCAGATSTETS